MSFDTNLITKRANFKFDSSSSNALIDDVLDPLLTHIFLMIHASIFEVTVLFYFYTSSFGFELLQF